MRVCKKCGKEFPIRTTIDGKERNLGSRSFCLTCSPFGSHNTVNIVSTRRPSQIDALPKEEFARLVAQCRTRSEFFDRLSLRKGGAAFGIFNRRIHREQIDTSHFQLGGSFSKTSIYADEDMFCENSRATPDSVKFRLLKKNLIPYVCSVCGMLPIWRGRKLVLQLDHINGMRKDHRLVNLRWICPNCHSQTPTYSGRNKPKGS